MGFIETLIPEAPALIEKNKTKRMFYKYNLLSLGMPVLRAHPNFCRRAKDSGSGFLLSPFTISSYIIIYLHVLHIQEYLHLQSIPCSE